MSLVKNEYDNLLKASQKLENGKSKTAEDYKVVSMQLGSAQRRIEELSETLKVTEEILKAQEEEDVDNEQAEDEEEDENEEEVVEEAEQQDKNEDDDDEDYLEDEDEPHRNLGQYSLFPCHSTSHGSHGT